MYKREACRIFMGRCSRLLFFSLGFPFIIWTVDAFAMLSPQIFISSQIICQGDLAIIRVTAEKEEVPMVSWMGHKIPLSLSIDGAEWCGFLGADLTAEPGPYGGSVKLSPSGRKKAFKLRVRKKDYGVRRLTVPPNMVDLDDKTLRRVKRESGIMSGLS